MKVVIFFLSFFVHTAAFSLSPTTTRRPSRLLAETEAASLTVVDGDSTTVVAAKGGDNLRRVLLDAKAKVYDFKGMLTNCNGGGQCGTCVVAIADEAFGPRYEWETAKLQGRPATHRLACQTLVVGGTDATITLRPPKE